MEWDRWAAASGRTMVRGAVMGVLILGGCGREAGPVVEPVVEPAVVEPAVVEPAVVEPVFEPAVVEPAVVEPAVVEPEAPPPVAAPMMVATAPVWRQSKSEGPPWSRVEIATVRFGVRPTAGEKVTILPRHPSLPPLELTIRKVVTHGAPRDGIPRWWEPVLEKVTERAYFDVRTPKDRSDQLPVDVVVVYPATPTATLLAPKGLDPADLPPSVLPKGVEIAVDVNGDGRPDTIESTVCTESPKRARCGEATAWEVHRREGDGWTLVHRHEPAT
jgi:hypothetical protein